MAEESTDGEVETQVYNQDSQDSIGEVSKTFTHRFFFLNCSATVLSTNQLAVLDIEICHKYEVCIGI